MVVFNRIIFYFLGLLKKETAVKPARGLTKQKATTSLAGLPKVTTRVTRRSAEQKQELMEQDVSNVRRSTFSAKSILKLLKKPNSTKQFKKVSDQDFSQFSMKFSQFWKSLKH